MIPSLSSKPTATTTSSRGLTITGKKQQLFPPSVKSPILLRWITSYNFLNFKASRVSMVSRSSLKEQHSTRRKTKKMAPLPAVHTLIPASMVAWSSSTGLPIPKVTVPPLPTFCHPLTEKNKPCTFCDIKNIFNKYFNKWILTMSHLRCNTYKSSDEARWSDGWTICCSS